jgi:hypothetical protein
MANQPPKNTGDRSTRATPSRSTTDNIGAQGEANTNVTNASNVGSTEEKKADLTPDEERDPNAPARTTEELLAKEDAAADDDDDDDDDA